MTITATVRLWTRISLYGFSDDNDDGGGDYDYVYGEWVGQQIVIAEELFRNLVVLLGVLAEVSMTPLPQNNNPYPTAFPYGNGMVLHFYQQQESSTTKTVHKVINKGLKTYV